jgi:malate synthase
VGVGCYVDSCRVCDRCRVGRERYCERQPVYTSNMPGRSLLLIRHVGHLMTSAAVVALDGSSVPEGILDAVFTGLGSLHDLVGATAGEPSQAGSNYVVQPKMHGPAEVRMACDILRRTERLLGLDEHAIKIGTGSAEPRAILEPASTRRESAWHSSTLGSWTAPATRSTPRCGQARWLARRT